MGVTMKPWREPDGWVRVTAWLGGAADPELEEAVMAYLGADLPGPEPEAEAG